MCGRYQLTLSSETLQQFLPGFELSAHQPRYNIAPTQHAPVIRVESGKRVYRQLRFGLIPAWAPEAPVPPLINARSESVFEKPSFRSAIQHQRCLIPATGFYEWGGRNGQKLPYLAKRDEAELLLFAGIWSRWQKVGERIDSFAILTRSAGEKLSEIHNRVPILLQEKDATVWLDDQASKFAIESIMKTADDDHWRLYPVSERVNSVKNDDPECELPRAVQQTLF